MRNHPMGLASIAMLLIAWHAAASEQEASRAPPAMAGRAVVLDTTSTRRVHSTLKPPVPERAR